MGDLLSARPLVGTGRPLELLPDSSHRTAGFDVVLPRCGRHAALETGHRPLSSLLGAVGVMGEPRRSRSIHSRRARNGSLDVVMCASIRSRASRASSPPSDDHSSAWPTTSARCGSSCVSGTSVHLPHRRYGRVRARSRARWHGARWRRARALEKVLEASRMESHSRLTASRQCGVWREARARRANARRGF